MSGRILEMAPEALFLFDLLTDSDSMLETLLTAPREELSDVDFLVP